jgi:chemotaxis response regulator CheB
MFGTLTERGGSITTVDALALGASDYVTEPPNTRSLEQTRSRSPFPVPPLSAKKSGASFRFHHQRRRRLHQLFAPQD